MQPLILIATAVFITLLTGCSAGNEQIPGSNCDFHVSDHIVASQRPKKSEELYLLLSNWVDEVRTQGHSATEADNNPSPKIEVLMTNVDQLNCRIETRMAFVDKVIRVKENEPQNHLFKQGSTSSILFVTDPADVIGGDQLLFLSSSYPAQMTILSIAPNMKCHLIYDSWNKNDLLKEQNTALDPIVGVCWLHPGQFLLKEGFIESMSRQAFSPRRFFMNITSAKSYKLFQEATKTGR